jgi:hypothetical protein
MPMFTRRSFASLAAAALLCAGVPAQGAPSFAVISEVAREVSVVTFQESTGSRLGANMRSRIDIPDGALDKVALVAAKKGLEKAAPGAAVWLLAPLPADLFDATQNPAVGDVVKFPADLAQAFQERGTTHLLLFQRFRGEANLKAARETLGSGRVDGLGFFVDSSTPLVIEGTSKLTKGYVAPYVFMRSSLIDAKTGKVLATQVAAEGRVLVEPATMAGTRAWDMFTPQRKIEMLRDGLIGEIEAALPRLMAALP